MTLLQVWSDDGPSKQTRLKQPSDFYVLNLCWSSDGTQILSLINDVARRRIIIRSTGQRDFEDVHRIESTAESGSIGLTAVPNTSWVAYPATKSSIAVFDLKSGQELFQLADGVSERAIIRALAASPNGRLLASTWSGETLLWDIKSREVIARVPVSGDDVAFAPDGRSLAIIGSGIHLWDLSRHASGE